MANDRQLARRDPFGGLATDPWGDFMSVSPVSRLARMSRLMDDMFGDTSSVLGPPLDLTETDDSYVLSMEIPGVKKEDLTIECRENTITIRGEKKSQRDDEQERAYRV